MTSQSELTPPTGDLSLLGRLITASNATFLAADAAGRRFVYKPVAGEAPLWDFPTGTLSRREVAAYRLSEASGFGVVPPTFWVDGPLGQGSAQVWVDDDGAHLIDLVSADDARAGWFAIVAGLDEHDREVVLMHADDPRLRRLALFDVLANNSDRKAGHVLVHGERLFGVDHGVCFAVDDKLRTVIWGWSGQPLTDDELALVARVGDSAPDALSDLSDDEVAATQRRARNVLRSAKFPNPSKNWPVIPWPPF